jgi:formylglycine-generating enzyme required for sulfatase activity/tRNA A-37 threonylcarbamoyl transferase component Bud32
MSANESGKGLSDGGTFAEQPKVDRDDVSLGGEATFAGSSKRRAADVSLGDERTLGGGDAAGLDTVIDDIEIVDLAARYKTEGTLGRGGMGEVLLALDTRLDRKVAIKRILGEAARSRTAVSRFLTEAKAIAALNHPNVVQIYDYGRAKDGPFLIMEYVDGSSLLDRCRDGALPLDAAVDVACQLCDGLAKAHDLGIVHRDIKPANVLLTKDGLPKLTDFGLAKAEAADHQMTMTGAVLGTPDFMPPEQRKDAALVDHRSDLWSLAATVYQMVTGRSPKIIRFDLLPGELTKVLGKALEDHKDDRYQTARELRDALKASLRAGAAAVEEFVQGQCPACGVKNDSSRRFCRGCGESLEAACLSCMKPMPLWEEICGSCGSKQTPLVDERRQEIAAKQAEAEGLLGDCEFNRAVGIATALRAEGHPKLRFLSGWAEAFLGQIETSRTEQTREAVAAIDEAGKHEAAYDYLSARVAIELIPAALQAVILPGMREPATAILERVKRKQAEALRLERLIKERLAAKQLDELLPEVERFLALQPDRKDVSKIREQLLDRRTRQEAVRDEAVAAAQASLASHDYERAQAALAAIAAAVVTPDVTQLRERVEGLVIQVQTLSKQIKERATGKMLDGLLPMVEKYLRLKPEDANATSLRASLVQREEKFETEIAARLKEARTLAAGCRFEEALNLLKAVPEARRSAAIEMLLEQATTLAALRAPALRALKDAATGGFVTAIAASREYRDGLSAANLTDPECAALLANAEAAGEQEKRARRLLFITGATAAGIVAVIMMVGVGWWIRASMRAASLASAITESRWEDALAIEPDNAAALVGRAKARLAETPADVAGAFADLDQAGRRPGAAQTVKPVRAEAHAWQAVSRAQANELDQAAQDLRAANTAGASADVVARAAAAIAKGWLGRGETAVAKGDIQGVRRAADAALAAGAEAGTVESLRARGMVLEARSLLTSDVDGAVVRMLEASLLDTGLVEAALREPGFAAVRAGVVENYRGGFDQAVARQGWEEALTIAGTAEAIDPISSTWVREAVRRVPPAALAALPPAALAELPPAALAALPPGLIMKIPTLRNSIGIELKLLPAGRFTMGEKDLSHQVTLTKPFYLGVYEVTNGQWRRVMGIVPSNWKDTDRPVENVSWDDAVEFCRKLSALPEERQAGRVYRLPTDAEWEYACRAGTETNLFFGDRRWRGEYAWTDGQTHPVGQKKPNAWGIYDMQGNVGEWCSDWHIDSYLLYQDGAVTDPQGPPQPRDIAQRVIRGAGHHASDVECMSHFRSWHEFPSHRRSDLGFRLALSPAIASPPEAGK